MSDRATPLLSARDVRYRYGAFEALCGLSLTIGPKDVVALLGRNGAGNSTLLRCLAGWYQLEQVPDLLPAAVGYGIFAFVGVAAHAVLPAALLLLAYSAFLGRLLTDRP